MSQLLGHLRTAKAGETGFDANQPLTRDVIQAALLTGYSFAIRYVRQLSKHEYDISTKEAQLILASGLGLMIVQHVPAPGWVPSSQDGTARGNVAVKECRAIGYPPGGMIWLDLEGVRPGSSETTTIQYCNNWHKAVASAGYLPGIYVGYQPGISARALYYNLRFTHYWAAYNVDIEPVVRGYQMRQSPKRFNIGADNDHDLITVDRLGSAPVILSPEASFA